MEPRVIKELKRAIHKSIGELYKNGILNLSKIPTITFENTKDEKEVKVILDIKVK